MARNTRHDDEYTFEPAPRHTGTHTHVAELYGEDQTLGLREWAKDAVLAGSQDDG